jgi:hypothetical protein
MISRKTDQALKKLPLLLTPRLTERGIQPRKRAVQMQVCAVQYLHETTSQKLLYQNYNTKHHGLQGNFEKSWGRLRRGGAAAPRVAFLRLYFLIGAFSALTAAGFLQAFLMARDQILRRRESAKIYRTVGMTEDDVNRLISYELRSVALRVFVYLVVGTIVINTFFSVFT